MKEEFVEFVSLTEVAIKYNSNVNEFLRSSALAGFLRRRGEDGSSIVRRRGNGGCTMAHPDVATFYEDWLSKRHSNYESGYRDAIARKYKGETEVWSGVGYCDVVTEEYAIEVKNSKGWKGAIGQAQAYAYFLNKNPAIFIFDGAPDRCLTLCKHLGVELLSL